MEFNFDWSSINGGNDPFAEKKSWESDERFYKLKRNEKDEGAAIIRFLPDGELKELNGVKSMGTILEVLKINANITKNGQRRFVSEYSPRTIGKADPFMEEFSRLWNAGLKDEAKKFGSTTRYFANIYIVKDPAAPENEGKVFLLDMSQTLANKIKSYLQPSEQERALGTEPIQLFNPLNGYNFVLKCAKGSNGFLSYDSSAPAKEASALFKTNEEAINFIKENCHKLSEFTHPDTYLSYDELKKKLAWVKFESDNAAQNTQSVQSVETQVNQNTQSVQSVTTTKDEFKAVEPQITTEIKETKSVDDELDDLLNSIK